MVNNLVDMFISIDNLKTNAGMGQFKNAKYLIRESLADSINVLEIE